MSRRVADGRFLAMALGISVACAGCASLSPGVETEVSTPTQPMSQTQVERFFVEEVDAIEGPAGSLRTIQDGIEVYLITDEAGDRVQLIASVAAADQVDPRVFNILLQANYYLTGEARYSVSAGVIYAVYVHPLTSLTRAEFTSGLDQVIALSKNFGSTYSSGKIELGVPRGESR